MNIFFHDGDLKPITVEFIGEEAADEGGPLRELFTLMYDCFPQKLMCGEEKRYVFQHDVHKLEQGHFEMFGIFTALALLHGFSGPHNFSASLANYLISRRIEASYNDIADYDLRVKLEEMASCNDQSQLDAIVSNLDERFEAGYNKPVISLEDKADCIAKISSHWAITRQLRELLSFEKGLERNGVLEMLRRHGEDAVKQFVYEAGHLTAKILREMFQCEFSEDGTVARQQGGNSCSTGVIFWMRLRRVLCQVQIV